LVELVVPFNTPSYLGTKKSFNVLAPNHYFLYKCSKCTSYAYIRQLLLVTHVHKWSTRNTLEHEHVSKRRFHAFLQPDDEGRWHAPKGTQILFLFLGMVGVVGFFLFSLRCHQVLNIFLIVPRLIPYSLP
jgi:hypothetical protein